jgi:hypothetical protein
MGRERCFPFFFAGVAYTVPEKHPESLTQKLELLIITNLQGYIYDF